MKTAIIKNRLNLARSLIGLGELNYGVPQEIIIEVTNRCNLCCPMCIRTHRDIEEKDLSAEEFCKLLNNISAYTERISIAGLGEPLLNSGIFEMVYQCVKRGFKAVLYTNATLLDSKCSASLLKAGLSGIVISFDGATSETYEYYRRGANFCKVKENIVQFLEIKKNIHSKVSVEIQMIILKHTQPEVKEFLRMWSMLGINSIRIKHDHMGVLGEYGIKGRLTLKNKKGLCAMPWRGPATINVKGNLYPCCVASEHNLMLGNVFDDHVENLWHSSLARKLRNDFMDKRIKLDSCEYCDIPLIPLLFSAGGTLISPSYAHRMLAAIERVHCIKTIFFK